MEKNLKSKFDIKNINNAFDLIKKAKNITLLTHQNPDGDGMSACAALESFLDQFEDKSVETIYPNKPKFESKIQANNLLIGQHKQTPDLLVILDSATYKRLYYPEEFKNIPSINIDHHVSNTLKGTYNFVDPNSSSACEVLFDLLKLWDSKKITKNVTEALLGGILYDTNIFHTQSTSAKTLKEAAELIDLGADLFKLKSEVLADKNPKIISLWGHLLNNIQITNNKKAAFGIITQEDLKKLNLTPASLIGFINFLSELSDIDISLLFYETEEDETKVSIRSKKYDVNALAKNFGGGGHKNAAGILIDKPIKEVVKEMIDLIEKEK